MSAKSKRHDHEPSDPFKARADAGVDSRRHWRTANQDQPVRREGPMATFDRLGQTLVATLTADALAGHEAINLAAEIYDRVVGEEGQAPTGIRHVVFDVQNVQYMDSMCVGVFVELLGKLQEAGGRIAMVNADQNVEYLFKLTRLDRLFPICRDVMKAIEAVERSG